MFGKKIMEFALSGKCLAAGPILWLNFGPEYAFTAMAGLKSINIIPLLSAFQLVPLKVSETASLITNYIQLQASYKTKSNKFSLP